MYPERVRPALCLLLLAACGTSSTEADAVAVDGRPVIDATGGLPALSDGFDGAALDPSWSVLNPQLITVAVSGSALRLTVSQSALWYNASQGPLVWKPVDGDFKVTAN